MKDLFIPYSKNPLLADLTSSYEALTAVKGSIAQLVSELKARRGERIGSELSHNLDDLRTRERERAYEVAAIRLEVANSGLMANTTALYNAVEAVRAALLAQSASHKYESIAFGVECGIAENNVICAVELIDEAMKLHSEVVYKQLFPMRWHYFGIGRTFKALANAENPREWLVMASGQGSKFRFNGAGDGETPPPGPYLTRDEAVAEASHWVGYADTIGGDAQLYNVRTGETSRWY
jgi:hypothetical protein